MRRIEAEQAVIGALLQDNTALYSLPDLKPEHFFLDDHRIIFSEIVKMIREGKSAVPSPFLKVLISVALIAEGFSILAN